MVLAWAWVLRGVAGSMGMRGMWMLKNLEAMGRNTMRYFSSIFFFVRGAFSGAKSTKSPISAEYLEIPRALSLVWEAKDPGVRVSICT